MENSTQTEVDLVFRAIGDATRRSILEQLSRMPSGAPIGTIAETYSASRQAVTKHVKMLETAGLVSIEERGRERWCHADLQRLQIIYNWVAIYRQFWTEKLDALGEFLDAGSGG